MKQRKSSTTWQLGINQDGNILDWSAGVDAITVIGQDHKSALPFFNEYDNVKVRLGIGHTDDRPFSLHGYRGKQCGSVRAGLKEDKTLLMVTGPEAGRVFAVSKGHFVKYTRIDLQVTLRLIEPQPAWASSLYFSENLQVTRDYGKMYSSYITSPDGDTMYINKRTSPTFGRMYDKSRDYMGKRGEYWRYEVEVKEENCDKLGRLLEVLDDHVEMAADYVAGWYSERGIYVPIGIRDTVSIPEMPGRVPHYQGTLDWLNKQVRPSLLALEKAGLTSAAEQALGVQLRFPEASIDQED